jgi:hypothetical protein
MNVDEQSEEKQTSTVGTSANGRHKNDGDELNELKKENVALKVFSWRIFFKLICFLSGTSASASNGK